MKTFLTPERDHLKKTKNFTFKYVVMLVVKMTSRNHLDVKLVTEYAVEDDTRKMTRIKVVEIMKNYLLVTLILNFEP